MRLFVVLLALALIAPAAAASQNNANCSLPTGTNSTTHLKDFPPALVKRMPGLGDSGAPFQTDAAPGHNNLPSNSLIRAYWRNDRWVIIYGTGGFANALRVLILDVPKNGPIIQISNTEGWRLSGSECQIVTDGLNAAPVKPIKR